MVCQTIKEGADCFFMSQSGCQFNGGSCHEIIEQCDGCQKIQELSAGKFCISFPDPTIKWRSGICSMATHVIASKDNGNGKINPLKASKRGVH